jgi:hypothetical protein
VVWWVIVGLDLIALNDLTPSVLLELNKKRAISLSDEQADLLEEVIKANVNIGKNKRLDERLMHELPKWAMSQLENYG